VGGDKPIGEWLQRSRIGSINTGQPAESDEDPGDIPIDDRERLSEANGENGSGRVGADSRQSQRGLECAREASAVFAHDLSGGAMQEARPLVVPETRPPSQDLLLLGPSQTSQGGEGPQKAPVVRHHDRNACLLEHDFGHPDPIGSGVLAPGQAALVSVKPTEQLSLDLGRVREGFPHGSLPCLDPQNKVRHLLHGEERTQAFPPVLGHARSIRANRSAG
jgi:hypothetical protein